VLKNRPTLLILVCLALAALVWLDNQRSTETPPQAADRIEPAVASGEAGPANDATAERQAEPGTAPAPLQLANPLASFDKRRLKDTVERPLLASSRRRPPANIAAIRPEGGAAAPKVQASSYDLVGVVRDGDRQIALLRKKSDGASFRVEVGDMIGGWRVLQLEATSVRLERADGTSLTVPLYRE
jgi:hypothetical protein